MSGNLTAIRDAILVEALPEVGSGGWSMRVLGDAAARAGFGIDMADAAFPGGTRSGVDHLADWADRNMLIRLDGVDTEALRVRDRVRQAVLTRLEVLAPYKEAVRQTMAYWTLPPRGVGAACSLWRTSDRIWVWAGDRATDYNRYTKRGLLVGVLSSTLLAWMADDDLSMAATGTFLDRRIENVLQLGKVLGRFSKKSGRR